jgi:death on curing protein
VIFLDLDSLLYIAARVLDGDPVVRDAGLLESALARPQASAFGADAYSDVYEKAAALLHSLARNHALVDGNKRLALAATIAFLGMNGIRLTLSNDEAYDLVISVAAGTLEDVHAIATVLESHSASRA